MVSIQFLTPRQVLRRNLLLALPVPTPNKTPVLFTAAWKTELVKIFASLPRGRDAPTPLGFPIFRLPRVLCLAAVQHGHPFTQGMDTVILPANFLDKEDAAEKRTVIIHELVHLDQRRHPEAYHRYYRTQGFVAARIAFDASLKPLLMYNPDGVRYEWIWTHRGRGYLPVAIEHRTYVRVLQDWTWTPACPRFCSRPRSPVYVKLGDLRPVQAVPEYYRHFQNKHQLYHPNEIVAHQITDALRCSHGL